MGSARQRADNETLPFSSVVARARHGTMGIVHRMSSINDAEREASTWFARMNADDVTPNDRARFEAWLGARIVNAKVYSELTATWQELVKSGPPGCAVCKDRRPDAEVRCEFE